MLSQKIIASFILYPDSNPEPPEMFPVPKIKKNTQVSDALSLMSQTWASRDVTGSMFCRLPVQETVFNAITGHLNKSDKSYKVVSRHTVYEAHHHTSTIDNVVCMLDQYGNVLFNHVLALPVAPVESKLTSTKDIRGITRLSVMCKPLEDTPVASILQSIFPATLNFHLHKKSRIPSDWRIKDMFYGKVTEEIVFVTVDGKFNIKCRRSRGGLATSMEYTVKNHSTWEYEIQIEANHKFEYTSPPTMFGIPPPPISSVENVMHRNFGREFLSTVYGIVGLTTSQIDCQFVSCL